VSTHKTVDSKAPGQFLPYSDNTLFRNEAGKFGSLASCSTKLLWKPFCWKKKSISHMLFWNSARDDLSHLPFGSPPWGIIWIKDELNLSFYLNYSTRWTPKGKMWQMVPCRIPKHMCDIGLFFRQNGFQSSLVEQLPSDPNLLPYFWKAYCQNTLKSSHELCYRLFYGCSRRFYEIRHKERKI